MVGTICIAMPDRCNIGPWLASLFVIKCFRGQGIGSLLIRAAIDYATRIGIHNLYLWAKMDNRSIYAQRGFTVLMWL